MYVAIIWVRWVKILTQRLCWTPLGVLTTKSYKNNVNLPDHTIPSPSPPRGYNHKTSIYKGATSRKSTHFPFVYAYPKQGYTEYQKIHSERHTMPFSQAITLKKKPGQTEINQSAQAYFFRIGMWILYNTKVRILYGSIQLTRSTSM